MHNYEALTIAKQLEKTTPSARWQIWILPTVGAILLLVYLCAILTTPTDYPLDCGTDEGTDWYEECVSEQEIDLSVVR
jgi:hypothetical protein